MAQAGSEPNTSFNENHTLTGTDIARVLVAATSGAVAAIAEEFGGSMVERIAFEISLHLVLATKHTELAQATQGAWAAFDRERGQS